MLPKENPVCLEILCSVKTGDKFLVTDDIYNLQAVAKITVLLVPLLFHCLLYTTCNWHLIKKFTA